MNNNIVKLTKRLLKLNIFYFSIRDLRNDSLRRTLKKKRNFREYITRLSLRFCRVLLSPYKGQLAADFFWKKRGASFVISLGVAMAAGLIVWMVNPWFMKIVRPWGRLSTSIGSGALILLSLGVYQNLAWQTLPILFRQERKKEREKEREIYRLAHFDILTGLHNRPAFEQHLDGALARAKRQGTSVAVGMIDLDDFKPVNDTWGHKAGDVLLTQLAQRLRSRVRDSDFLARQGGDEFIVTIEDLDPGQAEGQLAQIFTRFHQAVEEPFNISPTQEASVGMTMGVALFPFDAEDADGLIRQADAAMYQAKANKHHRSQWWQLGPNGNEIPRSHMDLDPYGPDAVDLLSRHEVTFSVGANDFVKKFYGDLADAPEFSILLANLRKEEHDALTVAQVKHLHFLMGATTTRHALRERAFRVGEIHALVGVDAALLVQSQSLYRRSLAEAINRSLPSSRDRYSLSRLAELRLQEDIFAELAAVKATEAKYFETFSCLQSKPVTPWIDTVAAVLRRLAALPGVVMCALMRPDSSGIFQFEAYAGDVDNNFCVQVELAGTQPRLRKDQSSGQSLIATAWLEGSIQSTSSYTSDPRTTPWHDAAHAAGVRSLAAIPLHAKDFTVDSVLVILGAYSGQFDSVWMKEFCRGLKYFWETLCERSHVTSHSVIIPSGVVADYRHRLFNGGLTMFVQPTVELRTGRFFKVEALARLQQTDGSLLPPSVFLHLLGQAELDWLFRHGLNLALQAITEWEVHELRADISVNLAPSSLLNPECHEWVSEALRKHNVAPTRLTLEILESQFLPAHLAEQALISLSDMGVHLALDDLGSKYSSLQRLAEWPFDIIKIDQGLLSRTYDKPVQTLSLIKALIQIGHDLDRAVVVEGLETADMVEAVSILGADYGQGYGLARPMPASAFPEWARTFLPPVVPGEINTALGALAYHWQFMHSDKFHNPDDGNLCPLTTFLAKRRHAGLDDAMHLHAEVHAKNLRDDEELKRASHALTVWLAERVREDRATRNMAGYDQRP